MSHADKADKLLIKPTAGARPASPCTLGRFIPKARRRGLTPEESRAARRPPSLATAPDGPTNRVSQTPERVAALPGDDWRSRDVRFRGPQLARGLDLAERLGRVGQRHGVSAGAVAVAWVLQRPGVAGAIVGFRQPVQIDTILGADSLELHADEIAEIETPGAEIG